MFAHTYPLSPPWIFVAASYPFDGSHFVVTNLPCTPSRGVTLLVAVGRPVFILPVPLPVTS